MFGWMRTGWMKILGWKMILGLKRSPDNNNRKGKGGVKKSEIKYIRQ